VNHFTLTVLLRLRGLARKLTPVGLSTRAWLNQGSDGPAVLQVDSVS
jgi:hypothetical protein